MTGYTKLFGSIITSTIWREDKETKILWITMLALKNKNGIVEGSIPGLADMARLSLSETLKALKVLSDPDEFSRSKEFDGRRIEPIDGGWLILNHAKWREKMNEDERREYLRVKQAEHRARQQPVNNSKQMSTPSTDTDTDTDADTKADKKRRPPNPLKGERDGFDLFWSEYPNKQAKIPARRAWLKIKPDEREEVMRGITAWKASESWLKDDGQFIPHPATFLNQRRFEDSPKRKPLKKKVYYNYIPPPREVPDAEWKSAGAIAKSLAAKLREELKK